MLNEDNSMLGKMETEKVLRINAFSKNKIRQGKVRNLVIDEKYSRC